MDERTHGQRRAATVREDVQMRLSTDTPDLHLQQDSGVATVVERTDGMVPRDAT